MGQKSAAEGSGKDLYIDQRVRTREAGGSIGRKSAVK